MIRIRYQFDPSTILAAQGTSWKSCFRACHVVLVVVVVVCHASIIQLSAMGSSPHKPNSESFSNFFVVAFVAIRANLTPHGIVLLTAIQANIFQVVVIVFVVWVILIRHCFFRCSLLSLVCFYYIHIGYLVKPTWGFSLRFPRYLLLLAIQRLSLRGQCRIVPSEGYQFERWGVESLWTIGGSCFCFRCCFVVMSLLYTYR